MKVMSSREMKQYLQMTMMKIEGIINLRVVSAPAVHSKRIVMISLTKTASRKDYAAKLEACFSAQSETA
ncbi:hypothetical protein [Sneathiella sp.]|uniref:hypothetical protein n=1 Tax=Sneathiella sp. TaxID=1964365 RepID=UPI003002059B